MTAAATGPRRNRILAALPMADYQRLLPDLHEAELVRGSTIAGSGDDAGILYFPASGIISVSHDLDDGSSSGLALVGSEGMVGISVFLGGQRMAIRCEVQCPGRAYRLEADVVQREFSVGGQLHVVGLLYARALVCQTSWSALCAQIHPLDQQLCRWLLMMIDRVGPGAVLPAPELLGTLLRPPRSSVAVTIAGLQSEGLLQRAEAGLLAADRMGLEQRVCDCYTAVTAEYESLLPAPG